MLKMDMLQNETLAIILAAGKGTRMKSDLPKVLHCINGKPLLHYVLQASKQSVTASNTYIIVGHQAKLVQNTFPDELSLNFVEQTEQLGTGHAVMQAIPYLQNRVGQVLILCGDTPLLTADTLKKLIAKQKESQAGAIVLTADLADPKHYGRIIRSADDEILAIREYRDCSPAEQQIKEINSGVYCFDVESLIFALQKLTTDNDQNEYYLTDTLEILNNNGKIVKAFKTDTADEIAGINTIEELQEAEKAM